MSEEYIDKDILEMRREGIIERRREIRDQLCVLQDEAEDLINQIQSDKAEVDEDDLPELIEEGEEYEYEPSYEEERLQEIEDEMQELRNELDELDD